MLLLILEIKMTKICNKSKFPIHHSYADARTYTMQMSNNITNLYVSNGNANGIYDQLTSAYIGKSVSQVEVSCFANCRKLKSINSDNHIRKISDYAFYNCESLEEINFLGDEERELYNIGNYAFAGSGLKNIKINLKSSVSDSSINGYAFANCKQLQSVEFVDAPFLGPHMFDGCTKLQNVKFTNKHNYTYPYCFANCTSLRTITLPANQYSLASHMFDGCTNLKEVVFAKDAILHYIEDGVFANCPSLTSITLPKSVNSLSAIDPNFLQGSSVKELHFSGILSSDLAQIITHKTTTTKYQCGKWYSSASDVNAVYKEAKSKHIPIMWYFSGGAGCGHCTTWKSIISKSDFTNWLENECNFLLVRGSDLVDSRENARSVWNDQISLLNDDQKKNYVKNSNGDYTYVIGGFYWNKLNEDNTTTTYGMMATTLETKIENASDVKKYAKSLFTDHGWEGANQIEYEVVIREEITTFGLGNGKTLTIFDADGNAYECTNDTVVKKPDYRTDMTTTDNFKFGIWYYNARELKAFADENHLPVLVKRSSKGCEPCIDFRTNTWKNAEFQNEIKRRPCLLCHVEADGISSFDSDKSSQEYFVAHEWCNPNTLIPELLYYWKKPDGSTYTYDWNYNYRTDAVNANYQTVLNRLDAMLGSYAGDPRYNAPIIRSCNNGQCLYYVNEENDQNGRYFICDRKTFKQQYSGSLQIDLVDYVIVPPISRTISDDQSKYVSSHDDLLKSSITSLVVGGETTLPCYTYQYFTSFDNAFFDKQGIIFKVDEQMVDGSLKRTIQYMYDFYNDETQNYVPKDTNKYNVGKLYSMDDTSDSSGFNDFLDYAGRTPTKMTIIFKIDDGDTSINTLIDDKSFQSWMKKSKHLFLKVSSSTWSANAPYAVKDLESRVDFDGNTDALSKILVLHHCLDCIDTPNGYIGEVYKAKAITYDLSKGASYYTALFDSYVS